MLAPLSSASLAHSPPNAAPTFSRELQTTASIETHGGPPDEDEDVEYDDSREAPVETEEVTMFCRTQILIRFQPISNSILII